MRAQCREIAFKVLFSTLFEENDVLVKENLLQEEKLSDKDIKFLDEIIYSYKENKDKIDIKLKDNLENYEIDRIYKVDLALIYLGITEILFIKTPKPVIINEILEIAKKYSTEKSKAFINGVLAKIE